ncbi:phospholipase D family protein [Agrobacterium sp. 22117]|uniref:phospholipase D family protein n=1 Tax=Agrobacterium sp. 22117 TaxID=3453880 RepID=UPI003F82819C
MRKDGDVLLEHVGAAQSSVLLCAPFIKVGVLKRLLPALTENVTLEVVTRWHPEEIAAGVSDLEVFDLIAARPRSRLSLLDNLHAKLYRGDGNYLAGSANLTATALGWCDNPNLELLLPVDANDPSVQRCLDALKEARVATAEEQERIRKAAEQIPASKLPQSLDVVDAMAMLWLPRFAAPANLFLAYRKQDRERLTRDNLEAADQDLTALSIPPGLSKAEFEREVGKRFADMPAVATLLKATEGDLSDAAAIELIETLSPGSELSAAIGWRIVREWLTTFMGDLYEIAPQSFITRPKPGAVRK